MYQFKFNLIADYTKTDYIQKAEMKVPSFHAYSKISLVLGSQDKRITHI